MLSPPGTSEPSVCEKPRHGSKRPAPGPAPAKDRPPRPHPRDVGGRGRAPALHRSFRGHGTEIVRGIILTVVPRTREAARFARTSAGTGPAASIWGSGSGGAETGLVAPRGGVRPAQVRFGRPLRGHSAGTGPAASDTAGTETGRFRYRRHRSGLVAPSGGIRPAQVRPLQISPARSPAGSDRETGGLRPLAGRTTAG